MDKLPTHRLLAYYKKLQRGVSYNEVGWPDLSEEEALRRLADTKTAAKAILDTREHVTKERKHD